MPSLDWIGKKAVVRHHSQVPYRLVRCNGGLSAGDVDSGNLLVQGDNLEALKALLPYYAGKVKCIYIDPPYNTGNGGWAYNDKVNSPQMRKWLGKTVGGEVADMCRHDKWLCMMYPRLQLLREFLRPDGVIFVSIDDNEVHNLRILLNEIFKIQNFITQLVWKTKTAAKGVPTNSMVVDNHEYIVCYCIKNFSFYGYPRDTSKYTNPDNDPRGLWKADNMKSTVSQKVFFITDPVTGNRYEKNWAFSESTLKKMIQENRIIFPSNASGTPRHKKFLTEHKNENVPITSILGEFQTETATNKLKAIFSGQKVFNFPKPIDLIKILVNQSTTEDDLILDSFAGSGTTAHAVLQLNKEDGGNRRFILVEMEDEICRKVTAKRLKTVISGNDKIAPLGGGFRFCTLGKSLFDESGGIAEEVKFSDLAHHVFFSETGSPIPKRADGKTPFLGVYQGRAYYLLYNGVMGDKTPRGGNVLTQKILRELSPLPDHAHQRVVFGERCLLSKVRLARENIVFFQIPYQIQQR